MTDRKAMLDLAAKVEAASGPDRELERQIATALGWTEVQSYQGGNIGKPPLRSIYPKQRVPKFSASVDAALSLASGFSEVQLWNLWNDALCQCSRADASLRDDLARFVASAALRARAAQ